MECPEMEYIGLWSRAGAAILDTVIYAVIAYPVIYWIYGSTYFTGDKLAEGPCGLIIAWMAPASVYIWFWVFYGQTPGKMAIRAEIVDAKTGGPISIVQAALRYIGYFFATAPLFLGMFWIARSPRKQGWHDLLAGTVVVRKKVCVPARKAGSTQL